MRIVTLLTLVAVAFSAAAAVIPVSEFQSIALSDGGHVTVRYGAIQRVTLIKGDLQYTRVRVEGQRLLIGDTGRECPRGYRLEVEVVTPHVSRVSVSNGGSVRVLGAFPAQASIAAAVEQGGMVDVRSIAADSVTASVSSGGRIYTTARKALKANVASGGVITYWGDVEDVVQSVRDGGVVTRGAAESR